MNHYLLSQIKSGLRNSSLALAIAALLLATIAPRAAALPTDGDNDGISDAQEAIDGTDSADPDSYIEHASNEYCVEWNGFLSNLLQVVELRNAGCSTLDLDIKLYDSTGAIKHNTNVSLPQSKELDLLANILPGFQPADYGLVCATITGGEPDTLDVQLSAYDLLGTSYNYAFSSPDLPARTGNQSISYNNFFPTNNATQLSNFTAGFLQVTNQESTDETGDLVFFDHQGAEIRRVTVTVKAKGRADVSTHDSGPNTFGTVEWQPANGTKKFRVVLNRYYFNGPSPADAVIGVVSLTGKRGSGATLATPFSTQSRVAVLEISNTLNTMVSVQPTVYDSSGSPVQFQPLAIPIPPKASRHLVLNGSLPEAVGNVQIQADHPRAIVVTEMEYGLDAFGLFRFASSSDPKAGFGEFQNVSYNNFLGECRLRVSNRSDSSKTSAISLTRYDGTILPIASPLNIPAHGAAEVDICSKDPQPAYGTVALTPSADEALTGQLIRANRSGSEFATPLRERSRCTPATLLITGSPLQLVINGAPGSLTVTNTSSQNFANNVAPVITGTALEGFVTVTGNDCGASLAPLASCTLTFTPGTVSGVAQTNFPILGSNTSAASGDIEVVGPTTLTSSVSVLGVAANGQARTITITNTGSNTAFNIAPTVSPALPAGTSLTPTSCATLAPSASCLFTVTPGSTPSAAPGNTNPTPITVSIHGTNTNTVSPAVSILDYGSFWEGGFLFAIFDSAAASNSVDGAIAAPTDQALPFPSGIIWSSNGSGGASGNAVFDNIPGIYQDSNSPCVGRSDGACNSSQITTFYNSINPSFYAAGLCKATIGGFNDWYLPSICELGYDRTSNGTTCGSQGTPLRQNMQSNLVDNGDIGGLSGAVYYSSTEVSAAPSNTVWTQLFATGGTSNQTARTKDFPLAVRCVRLTSEPMD